MPAEYLEQLEVGGKLVMPVGDQYQQTLLRIIRQSDGTFKREQLMGCRFVPLIGEHGWQSDAVE